MSGGEPSSIKRICPCDAGSLSVHIFYCYLLALFITGEGLRMSYKVLYRKYRPMAFSDVVGQPQVTLTLQNELTAGRISHAYLFTGSRGTGKTTCAKILAKAVNCLNPKNGDPCGECEICAGLDNGSIMDVVEIDAASNNGVDSIRSLIEEAAFTPGSAKYRVYIIDEVHMLSTSAFNALLKTLEEPPAHVIFILATTEVHRLLPTILSRCQRFDFKRINPDDIADRLEYVCEKEGVRIERGAGLLIARISDGGMRDALSILDQCIGRAAEGVVTEQIVNDAAGIAGRDYLFSIAEAIKNRDCPKALEIIAGLYDNSKDMGRLCEEMSSHFRKLMLIKTMKNPGAMIVASEDEMKNLTSQGLSMTLATVIHCMDVFQTALDKMKYSNQRIELEMSLIRLCSPELDSTPEALIRRIEALEQGAPRTRPQKEPEKPVNKAVQNEEGPPASPKEEQVKSQPKSQDELIKGAKRFNEWPEVLQIMKQYSQSVAAAFGGSSAYISGGYVLISGSQLAFDLLKTSSQRERMKEAIYTVTGRNYNLGPYKPPEKEADPDDPLAALEAKAREAGIEVNEI